MRLHAANQFHVAEARRQHEPQPAVFDFFVVLHGRKQFVVRHARHGYWQAAGDEQIALPAAEARFNPAELFRQDATIDAYYSTKEGLVTELGWDAAKPLIEFKGCTHPEHQI